MKALLLAATSSLALTGFAMAQTSTAPAAPDASASPMTSTDVDANASGMGTDTTATTGTDSAGTAATGTDAAGTTTTTDGMSSDTTTAAPMGTDTATGSATATGSDTGTPTAPAATAVDGATDVDVVDNPTDSVGSTDTATGMTGTDTTGATTTTTDVATTTGSAATTEQVVEAPDVAAPILSAENPGMLASAVIGTRVYTTNQPSTAVFTETEMTERPADWADIAQVDDIVFNSNGDVVGYIADIGGFLGIGAKKVLLGVDALHMTRVGNDVFYATNFTEEELRALPDFDNATVMR